MDVLAEVARGRRALADVVDGLDPAALDAGSWCAGWRCRDVLGHLVHLSESTQRSMFGDLLHNGMNPDRTLARRARDLAERPIDELTRRLRASAGGTFHVIGMPRLVIIGELLVHGSDMLRPLGQDVQADPEVVAPVVHLYRRIGRVAFHNSPARKVTLEATDTDMRLGNGPEVTGRALDLLLLLANRPQALPALTGPGVELLKM